MNEVTKKPGKKKPKKPPQKGWNPDQFKKSNQRGNPEQWKKAANQFLKKRGQKNKYLELLGLDDFPKTLAELKTAYRKKMIDVHPDKPGGSEETAKQVNDAYENLLEIIGG